MLELVDLLSITVSVLITPYLCVNSSQYVTGQVSLVAVDGKIRRRWSMPGGKTPYSEKGKVLTRKTRELMDKQLKKHAKSTKPVVKLRRCNNSSKPQSTGVSVGESGGNKLSGPDVKGNESSSTVIGTRAASAVEPANEQPGSTIVGATSDPADALEKPNSPRIDTESDQSRLDARERRAARILAQTRGFHGLQDHPLDLTKKRPQGWPPVPVPHHNPAVHQPELVSNK